MIPEVRAIASSSSEQPRSIRQVGAKGSRGLRHGGIHGYSAAGTTRRAGLYIVPRRPHNIETSHGQRRGPERNLYESSPARFPADRARPAIRVPEPDLPSYGDRRRRAPLAHGLRRSAREPTMIRVMVQSEKTRPKRVPVSRMLRAGPIYCRSTAATPSEVEYLSPDCRDPRRGGSDPASQLPACQRWPRAGQAGLGSDQHGKGA